MKLRTFIKKKFGEYTPTLYCIFAGRFNHLLTLVPLLPLKATYFRSYVFGCLSIFKSCKINNGKIWIKNYVVRFIERKKQMKGARKLEIASISLILQRREG